jgi:hypothetical protein
MTEAEWLACNEPRPMIDHLREKKVNRNKRGRRKLRLFGCGCRRIEDLLSARGRRWLDVAERYADGDGESDYCVASKERPSGCYGQSARQLADLAAWHTLHSNFFYVSATAPRLAAEANELAAWEREHRKHKHGAVEAREKIHQATLLRDIFGNPFHPSPVLPSAVLGWNDGTVHRMAEGIYEERAFDRLPILHDALLDAGCDDEDILAHCRSAGPHVRGCWALDLILGKS